MFVTPTDRPPRPQDAPGPDGGRARESLALLAERTRPVSSSQTQLLPVAPPLVDLFPDGSLRRGSTIVVTGLAAAGGPAGGAGAGGGISLALALLAAASGAGCWCALVGLPGLGAVATHDLGIDLARLAVVPRPDAAWAEVTAALIDGVDLVVLCPPFPPRPAMARRLVARARERRSVLVVTGTARVARAPRCAAAGQRPALGRRRGRRGVPAPAPDDGDRHRSAVVGRAPATVTCGCRRPPGRWPMPTAEPERYRLSPWQPA